MNLIKIISSLTIATFTLTACGTEVKVPPPPTPNKSKEIKIDINSQLQTMDGFGASDAWRCQMVGKYWPDEKRNHVADLLFSQDFDNEGNPKGIGLSIWRFYLGAGSMEQGAESKITDEWRRAECFQNPDGTYDWSKQEGQRWFLQAAKKRGVDKYLAFTISAPVQMTKNGKAAAETKGPNMNIKEGMIPDYAEFLVECIDNLQKQEGIKFDYLSPINEPQWDWALNDQGVTSQEGTPATTAEMAEFTKSLSEKLNAKSLSTQIALGEAAQIDFLYQDGRFPGRVDHIKEFFDPASANKVGGLPNVLNVITGHSYFTTWPIASQISTREKLASRLKQYNVGYWQTEYCILENPGAGEIPGGGGGQRDLGIKTALYVARVIHNDIAVSNASSWQWWTALTRADYKDGLIYLDNGSNNGSNSSPDYCKTDGYVRDSKTLWALGNYSLFVRPGMVRVAVDGLTGVTASTDVMATAYLDKATKKFVVVAINCADKDQKYKVNVNGKLKDGSLTPYVTSETSNLKKGTAVKAESFEIPARSVVTYVGTLE